MQENQTLFSLNFDTTAKSHLLDTAKWARFLSISGMILMVLFIVAAILGIGLGNTTTNTINGTGEMGDQMNAAFKMGMILVSLVMGIIIFFPLLFLLRFSNNMRTAINANDQEAMNEAFLNMKRYFRFLGILFIIGLAFYALTIVMVIVGSTLV